MQATRESICEACCTEARADMQIECVYATDKHKRMI